MSAASATAGGAIRPPGESEADGSVPAGAGAAVWEDASGGSGSVKFSTPVLIGGVVVALLVLVGAVLAATALFGGGIPKDNAELADWLNGDGLNCSTGKDSDLVLCATGDDQDMDLSPVFIDAGDGVYEVETLPADLMEELGGDTSETLKLIGDKTDWWTAATIERMLRTRALDGTQTEGDASWTYHPDSGLQVIVSAGG